MVLYAETISFQVDPLGGVFYFDVNGNGAILPNRTVLNQLSIETGFSGWDIEDTSPSGDDTFFNNFIATSNGFITANGVDFTPAVGLRVEASNLGTENGTLRISLANNLTFNNSSLLMNEIDFTGITDDNFTAILQRAIQESAAVMNISIIDLGTGEVFRGIDRGDIVISGATGLVPEPGTYIAFLLVLTLLGLTRLQNS